MTLFSFDDAARLLGLAAARDQRTVGRADILAWQADLDAAGLTLTDAEQALSSFYQEMASRPREQRYRVTPVDLIDIAKRSRRERLVNFRYEASDPDETPQQYLARLRARTRAVADGQIGPDEGLRVLGRGPSVEFDQALAGVVRQVSDEDTAVSPARPARSGPLTVSCPACQAPLGRHCRANARPRTVAHAARRRAAREVHGMPQDDDASVERRRAAATAALDRLTVDERAQLDAFQTEMGHAS